MREIIAHRYQVEQKLAAGGFGAIYRATDLTIGRAVALKILHRELARDASVVARFRREAAALAKLKSPNTLTLYDVGETDDTLYLVMELLRGESLQDLFDRSGTLAWRRMARIARGICNSLREAHASGIVHRDLKPANIFLESHALEDDFVKVLDFGIAKVLESSELENTNLTQHGQTVGTFDYMAPEQMLGGSTTTKTDVFTLGVVIYEMITGKRPYGEAPGPASMLMALLSAVPTPLSGLPTELARTVMRCISREAAERPDIVELDEVLARVIDIDDGFGDADETTMNDACMPKPLLAAVTRGETNSDADDDLDDETDLATPVVAGDVARSSNVAADIAADIEAAIDAAAVVPPPARRTTLPRGSVQPSHVLAELVREARPVLEPVHVPPVMVPDLAVRARGSQDVLAAGRSEPALAPYARGSEPVLADRMSSAALAVTLDVRGAQPLPAPSRACSVAPVEVRFHPTTPVPTPKSRLAAGTSPIVNDRTANNLPAEPQSTMLVLLRYATIATCLFALGFFIALAIAST